MEIPGKALQTLELDRRSRDNAPGTANNRNTATMNQDVGRRLYEFAERHERRADASAIYANVGLACLAIRRVLQACYPLFDGLKFLTNNLGSTG